VIAVEAGAAARRRDEEYRLYFEERQRGGCAGIGRED
jgi:hypothetical protein